MKTVGEELLPEQWSEDLVGLIEPLGPFVEFCTKGPANGNGWRNHQVMESIPLEAGWSRAAFFWLLASWVSCTKLSHYCSFFQPLAPCMEPSCSTSFFQLLTSCTEPSRSPSRKTMKQGLPSTPWDSALYFPFTSLSRKPSLVPHWLSISHEQSPPPASHWWRVRASVWMSPHSREWSRCRLMTIHMPHRAVFTSALGGRKMSSFAGWESSWPAGPAGETVSIVTILFPWGTQTGDHD